MRVQLFNGKQIHYEGVGFAGSPHNVFWGRYIEPFLEDLAILEIRNAAASAKEREVDARAVLLEVGGMLKGACAKVYQEMAVIDQRLRGKGYPNSVHARKTDSELAMMSAFIDQHVSAEVQMLRKVPGARVFISCGQNSSSGELAVAEQIASALADFGFEPYVAITQQTLEGLKENIFSQLRDAEYFLFVDFKREPLAGHAPLQCRGSLFANQELAIAAYLGMEVIAFQEEGVMPHEGILNFLQTNAIKFADRAALPGLIVEEVKKRDWNPKWRNILSIECSEPTWRPATTMLGNSPQVMHFYGLRVHNRHPRREARNAYGYLDKIVSVDTRQRVEFDTCELKWGGYTLPNARISANGYRALDAFAVLESDYNAVFFSIFTDSDYHRPRIKGPGEWILTYSVVSDTVPGSSRSFRLKLDQEEKIVGFAPED